MTTPAANADAPTETQGTEEAQSSGPDFSPVLDRLEQIETQVGPVLDYVQSQQHQASADPDADYQNFIDSLFSGDEGNGQGQAGADPYQQEQAQQIPQFLQDPQMFQQTLDRAIERGVEQRVGPRLEAFENDRLQRQVNEMLDELPGLQDPQVQHDTLLAAQQIAHEMGQPEAWRHPAFFKMAYLSRLAQERSNAEVPADASGGEAQLEHGGGGNPGSDEPGLAQQIIQAHNGRPADGMRWF